MTEPAGPDHGPGGLGPRGHSHCISLTIYFKLGFRIAPDRVKTLSQIDTCKAMFTFQKEKREQRENKRSFFFTSSIFGWFATIEKEKSQPLKNLLLLSKL